MVNKLNNFQNSRNARMENHANFIRSNTVDRGKALWEDKYLNADMFSGEKKRYDSIDKLQLDMQRNQ